MSVVNTGPGVELLESFSKAWNDHDVEALMSMMSDDCHYFGSAGTTASGSAYHGRDAVRAGYAAIFETYPDAHWGDAQHAVWGDRGYSEWTFTGTTHDGAKAEVRGCDLFTFAAGRISVKDSYRKNRLT
jgi:ketosteroid isomerase-like protein